MKLLGIDSTARVASVCICEDERIVGEMSLDAGLTHSQTILAMAEDLLRLTGLTPRDIDAYAAAQGPGSFTGVRIGIAAIKGMSFAHDTPCMGVSTLEALAYNLRGQHGVACAVMDARCSQVYTAAFLLEEQRVTRLTPDSALLIGELEQSLRELGSDLPVFLVGDGSELCYNNFGNRLPVVLAPAHLRYQRASSVCAAALKTGARQISAAELEPLYLRLPQAERERIKRLKESAK